MRTMAGSYFLQTKMPHGYNREVFEKGLRRMFLRKGNGTNNDEPRDVKSIEDYIKNRLDDQIKWYDNKAASSQKCYKVFQIAELIIAAVIPLLSGYAAGCNAIAAVIGIGGALITLIEGICKLFRFHENWIEYRATCELLRHEKYLYQMKAFPYCKEESYDQLFVKNVEALISSESSRWKANNAAIIEEEKKPHSSTGS